MGRGEGQTEAVSLPKRAALSLLADHRRLVSSCLSTGGPDWQALENHPWIKELAETPQDPRHHGEGDVLRHTQMVVREMLSSPAFANRGKEEQDDLLLAALLHDIAKPVTTVIEEDGTIRSPGHSRRGEMMARQLLWAADWPTARREKICALIRYHMLPGHALEQTSPKRMIAASLVAGWQDLALLSMADMKGRIADDEDELMVRHALAVELASELGCLDQPYPFANDHSRFEFFIKENRDPSYAAYDDTAFEVTVMCALPGSGKDTWLSRNYEGPIISLDALREQMNVDPESNQGTVIQAAYEQARVYMRAKQSFAWNATSLLHQHRIELTGLVDAYGGRVKIVCIDTPASVMLSQNASRSRVVPDDALNRMLSRWEFPDPSECHTLEAWQGCDRRLF